MQVAFEAAMRERAEEELKASRETDKTIQGIREENTLLEEKLKVRQVLQKQADYMANPEKSDGNDMYLDMPDGFVDEIQKHINTVKSAAAGFDSNTKARGAVERETAFIGRRGRKCRFSGMNPRRMWKKISAKLNFAEKGAFFQTFTNCSHQTHNSAIILGYLIIKQRVLPNPMRFLPPNTHSKKGRREAALLVSFAGVLVKGGPAV